MKRIHAFDKGMYNPYKMSNVAIKSNQALKENRVLLSEDFFDKENPREWEVRFDNGYPTVFYDPNINKYRCYYSTFILDESSSEVSLEERKNKRYSPTTERVVGLCYAESIDGIHWKNCTNMKEYEKALLCKDFPIIDKEYLTDEQWAFEYIIMRMRLKKGLSLCTS